MSLTPSSSNSLVRSLSVDLPRALGGLFDDVFNPMTIGAPQPARVIDRQKAIRRNVENTVLEGLSPLETQSPRVGNLNFTIDATQVRCCARFVAEIISLVEENQIFIKDMISPVSMKGLRGEIPKRVLTKIFRFTGGNEPLTYQITRIINKKNVTELVSKAFTYFDSQFNIDVLGEMGVRFQLIQCPIDLLMLVINVNGVFNKGCLRRDHSNREISHPGQFKGSLSINLNEQVAIRTSKVEISEPVFDLIHPTLENKVWKAIEWILENQLEGFKESEGIFRESPIAHKYFEDFEMRFKGALLDELPGMVYWIKDQLYKSDLPYFYAGVVKLLLRKYSHLFLAHEECLKFLELSREDAYSSENIISICRTISPKALEFLRGILEPMSQLAAMSDISKMSAYNLAVVLAPSIFGSDPQHLLALPQIQKIISLLQFMIHNYEDIFDPLSILAIEASLEESGLD